MGHLVDSTGWEGSSGHALWGSLELSTCPSVVLLLVQIRLLQEFPSSFLAGLSSGSYREHPKKIGQSFNFIGSK